MAKYFVRALQPQGFWRGGLFFPFEGKEIDTEELTGKQTKLILSEKRMLLAIEIQEKQETVKDAKENGGQEKDKARKDK